MLCETLNGNNTACKDKITYVIITMYNSQCEGK